VGSADSINFQSLNVVRDELLATIEKAATDLEIFVSAQDDGKSLQSCIDGIRQIVGILHLLEFRGAALLAEELLANANEITVGETGPGFEKRLEHISSAFFTLSRYLEYVQQYQYTVPALLTPSINELRKLRREKPIPESHFFSISFKSRPELPQAEVLEVPPEQLKPILKRLRHMYQMGLLLLLQGKAAKPALAMMRRALGRLYRLSDNDKPLTLLWWLGNATVDAMIQHDMEILETRKLLLSRLDRIIKEVVLRGSPAFSAEPPKGLVKDLVYLLILSGAQTDAVKRVSQAYEFDDLGYTDKDLVRERQALSGPSAQTVSSLALVLRTELGHAKRVLEAGATSTEAQIDDLEGFVQTLAKVAEILLVVGLCSPGRILKQEVERVKSWQDKEAFGAAEELQAVADTLLFVESTVASLEQAKLSDAKLAEVDEIMQHQIIASGELAEAQRIVIEESEAGLTLTMRALNAYSESDFDSGHIRNLAKSLSSVRGAMFILERFRAAAILERCVEFVDEVLMQPHHPPAIQELLETFADAIMSVEYYLDTGGSRGQGDESVLQLAEDSLKALGYPVDK
jgi:hypothetical protein